MGERINKLAAYHQFKFDEIRLYSGGKHVFYINVDIVNGTCSYEIIDFFKGINGIKTFDNSIEAFAYWEDLANEFKKEGRILE